MSTPPRLQELSAHPCAGPRGPVSSRQPAPRATRAAFAWRAALSSVVALALALVLALGPSGQAAEPKRRSPLTPPPPPSFDRLMEAYRRSDPIELDRVARRLGLARLLTPLMNGGPSSGEPESKAARIAALAALPHLELAHAALSPLLSLLLRGVADGSPAGTDVELARATAQTVARLALATSPELRETLEIPPELTDRQLRELVKLVTHPRTELEVRLSLMDAIGGLLSGRPAELGRQVGPLLSNGGLPPAVRRAAADLLGTGRDGAATGALVRAVLADGDDEVAAAAGAALCPQLATPLRPSTSRGGAPTNPKESVVRELLHSPAAPRLRRLAALTTLSPTDILGLLPCLIVFNTPEDRALAAKLTRELASAPAGTVPSAESRSAATPSSATTAAGSPATP